ncbi:MAG: hypothetical protein ABW092_09590 [Candidatus Thiodiazotropha sp.]
MIWKIAGWVLVASGLLAILSTGMSVVENQIVLVSTLVHILLIGVLPLFLGIFVFRKKKWAVWCAFVVFVVQIVGLQTPQFSFYITGPIDLIFSFSLTDKETGQPSASFIFNIYALIIWVLLVEIVRPKAKADNS